MAGFFGLFNYEKEGPGISKNAPKKKGFIVFFETKRSTPNGVHLRGAPSGTRTRGPLIKSQLLYQLS